MTSTQSEITALLDRRCEAIWAKDLGRLLSYYSPDVVYFDVVPPLQYVGIAALRGRFQQWFDGFEGPIGQEIRELKVSASGDTAVSFSLIRASGKLKLGPEISRWVRATSCHQRSDGQWLVTHEHVSVPVDITTGAAAVQP